MQTTAPGHKLVTGSQVKMVGIAKDDGRTDGSQVVRGYGLDRTHRAHGHEDGGGDNTVRRAQQPGTGRAVRMRAGKDWI